MSNTEANIAAKRSNFASRMLTKTLTERKTGEQNKATISPSDAAQYAAPVVAETESAKEKVSAS